MHERLTTVRYERKLQPPSHLIRLMFSKGLNLAQHGAP